jgi:hypothetical protein
MRETMIYEDSLNFEELILNLTILQNQINAKLD